MLLDEKQGGQRKARRIKSPLLAGICREQNPDVWWEAVLCCLSRLGKNTMHLFTGEVAGISFSAQMRSLSRVDADGRPIRPAIL